MEGRPGLPAGTVLDGSYRIVRMIGAGGFGITYEAEDIELRSKVAIKEYFPAEFGGRDETLSVRPRSEAHRQTFEWGRSSFLEEAQTLVRFKHPSIVRITRTFRANGTAYMVMDFEVGQSFETWLGSLGRAPTQEELDEIIEPLLGAIGLMHASNILHRDIAPDNIIVRPDGTPVLLDFGAARRAVAEMSRALTGIIKPGYSPHEQYATDGRLQGPWSDLYAFGATFYRAVTGKPPDESTLRVTDDCVIPAAQATNGVYRAGFLSAIDACLRVQPSQRPQSVAVLRVQLGVGNARGTQIAEQSRRSPVATRIAATAERLHWRPLVAAVALVLVGGTYVGYHYSRGTGNDQHQTPDAEKRLDKQTHIDEARRKAGEEEARRKQVDTEAKRKAEEKKKSAAEEEKARQTELERQKAEEEQAVRVREAAAAWESLKETTSIAALEAYIARFPGSFYSELARLRIADLKRQLARQEQERAEANANAAWGAVRNSNSISELEAYLTRYPQSKFAEQARLRIAELKNIGTEKLPGEGQESPLAGRLFDGKWLIHRVGPSCANPNTNFSVTVDNSVASGRQGGGAIKGKVSEAGVLNFSHPNSRNPRQTVDYAGKLLGDSGEGNFKGGGRCHGNFTAKRIP